MSWNVLAAPWAAPVFYPSEMDMAVLDRATRGERVASVLASLGADVMCLQETTPPDLARVLDDLGTDYDGHAAPNGAELWANWSTPELAWEPNGTAIIWRREVLTDVVTDALALTADGNVATVLRGRHVESGRPIRVVSVHLDVDGADARRTQLPVALGGSATDPGEIDVVAGDCNEDTLGTDLGAILADRGFLDALTELDHLEPTHPYARPGDDYSPLARLDHILVRGAVPETGKVVDSGVWAVDAPGARLEAHLRRTGSDHLPVMVTLSC